MKRLLLTTLCLAAGLAAAPFAANASERAFATTNVNLRAGPSTDYPAVDVVGQGDSVRVFGCLSTRSWCDVGYGGIRGWMSSKYLAYSGPSRRYVGPSAVEVIEAPIITFSLGGYWDDHYRSRGFYRDRARYEGRWDRRHERYEAREDWRDDRQDRRIHRLERRVDRRDRYDDYDGRHPRGYGDIRDYQDAVREDLRRNRGIGYERPVPLYRVD